MAAAHARPRTRLQRLRRSAGRAAAQLGLLAAAVLVVVLAVQLNDQLETMRAAPQDDVNWTLTQFEVDVIALEATIEKALSRLAVSGGDVAAAAGALAEVRSRFDILWSRVDVLANGRAFAELRRAEAVHEGLSAVRRFLRDAAPIIDGSDDALADRLEEFGATVYAMRDAARRAVIKGVQMFAVLSDAQRAEFTRLVQTTGLAAMALIVTLAATLMVLRRAVHTSNARGRENLQSRQRFAAAINASLDAIVVADAQGRVLVWSHAAEQVFGHSRSTAIGADMAELIVPPSLRVFHRRGMERYLATGERRMIGSGRQETRGLRADGTETPIEVSIAAAQGDDGPIFTAFIRDISDRIEADRALMRARDEAMAADNAKTEFIAVMSHEMRTPLNGVLGTMDLLSGTELSATQRRYVATAIASGEILLRHVNDVLDIVRIEADRFAPKPTPFLPDAMLERLALVSRSLTEAGGNRMWIDADLPDGALVGDTRRIEQVLLNLLGNAAKFTQDGVITLEAKTVSSTPDRAVIEFAVRDSGPGVAPADHERIFQDFVTLDASYERASSGTGLGLGICRRIVGALGGDIGLESELGHGARFWVRIAMPRVAAEEAAEFRPENRPAATPVPAKPASPALERQGLPSLHVLVVEDIETNRFVAREMLTGQGHLVEMASNGQLGVEAAEAWAYDLILMDISMPGMDGVAATKAIREGNGPSARTTILGLTAHALPEEQKRFRDAGMDGCLTKPLRLTTLVDALAQLEAAAARPAPAQDAPEAFDDEFEDDDEDIMDSDVLAELSMTFAAPELASLLLRAAAETREMSAEIAAMADRAELSNLRPVIHKLAGTVGLVGGKRLHAVLFAAESACKSEDLAEAMAAIAQLPPLADATAEALRALAGDIQHSDTPAASKGG
ncbi:MAG: PAS domain S-box-containing protein [Paracoccaceae bacterium]|jgi:PAS domain S-box-containing protein